MVASGLASTHRERRKIRERVRVDVTKWFRRAGKVKRCQGEIMDEGVVVTWGTPQWYPGNHQSTRTYIGLRLPGYHWGHSLSQRGVWVSFGHPISILDTLFHLSFTCKSIENE